MRGYCAPLSDSAFGIGCLPDDDLDLLESGAQRHHGHQAGITGPRTGSGENHELEQGFRNGFADAPKGRTAAIRSTSRH